MALGLGSSLNTIRKTSLAGVITANRTLWSPFDSPGTTGTAYTGQALEFDGVGDHIDFTAIEVTKLTIAAWVNYNSAAPSLMNIVDTSGDSPGQYVSISANKIAIYAGGSTAWAAGSTTLSHSTWYRLVWTWDSSDGSYKMYVNGVLDSSFTETNYSSANQFHGIGALDTDATPSRIFMGMMSDFQLWDTVWTTAEAAYDYANPEKLVLGNSGTSLTYSDLKLWYPMQDGDRGNQSFLLDGANTGFSDELVDNSAWTTASVSTAGFIEDTPGTWTVHTTGDLSFIIQAGITLASADSYKLTYTITNSAGSGGSAQLRLSGGNSSFATQNIDGNDGTHTVYLISGANGGKTNLQINENGFVGTISNISLKSINLKNHGTSVFHGDELQSTTFTNSDLLGFTSASATGFTAVNTDAGAGANDNAYGKALSLTAGHNYTLSWTTVINAGDLSQQLDVAVATSSGGGAGDTATAGTHTAADDYTNSFIAATTDTYYVVFRSGGNGAYNFTISNVTLKEVGFATGWTDADAQTTIPQLGFQSYNQLAWFDGTADYVTTGTTFQSTFRDSFTLSAWVIFNDGQPSAQTYIMGARDGAGDDSRVYFNIETSGKIRVNIEVEGTSLTADTASAVFSDGATDWAHIVAVADVASDQIYIYVNGVTQTLDGTNDGDIDSTDFSNWTSADNFYIGAANNDATAIGFLEGSITEVSIFNSALTLAKVQELYNDGEALDALTHSSAANLAGYWRNRNGGHSSSIPWTDLSGNGNDGTATDIEEHLLLPEGRNGRDTQGFLMDRVRTSGINMPSQRATGAGYIDAGAITLSASDSFTLSWWIKPTDLNDQYMFGRDGNNYILLIGGTNLRFNPSNASYVTLTLDTAVLVDKWLHLTITRIDDGKTNLFVNGIDQDTEQTLNEPFEFRYIGGLSFYNFKGVMDDVALYDGTALTAAQILRNYKAGKGRHRN